jgi:hypothetical protein
MSAHYFGSEVKRTKRCDMGKRVGNHARNLLLMTATPHNGKDEDFQLFMALLDEDRFAGQQKDAVHRSDPTDLMRRLVKEDLHTFAGTKLFPERRSCTAEYELSEPEKVLYEKVTEYVREEMNRADRNAQAEGGSLVIPVGLLLAAGAAGPEAGPDAAARKRVELLAMNAVFAAEKALGRMPRGVSAQRGLGYDIESVDDQGDLFFIEVKGRVNGAESATLTINEVNTGRISPHRFRLALVTVTGDQAAAPVYVSGIDWGVPGFGDTQITKNLNQLLAAGKEPHGRAMPC